MQYLKLQFYFKARIQSILTKPFLEINLSVNKVYIANLLKSEEKRIFN